VLNVKPVCRSVGIGDVAADTGFISGVDPQSISTGFAQDVEPSFVESSSCRNTRQCLGMSVWRTQLMINQFLSYVTGTRLCCSKCWWNMLMICQIVGT
jgi:hypothetical protein